MNGSKNSRCLGIIGGLGVGATVHYYQAIVRAHKELGRAPRLLIAHADVDRVLGSVRDRDFNDLAQYLAGFANELAEAGAEIAAIAAITPHVCIAEISQSRLPSSAFWRNRQRNCAVERVALLARYDRKRSLRILRVSGCSTETGGGRLHHDSYVEIASGERPGTRNRAAV